MLGTPFVGVTYGAIAFADVDGDNDQDVLITGDQVLGSPAGLTSKLYTNDGTGTFAEMMGTPFTGVMADAVAFADVDGDNDQDVLITGGFGGLVLPFTGLYANDGSGNFTQIVGTTFDDLRDGSIAFADVDGNNYPDVLLTGVDLSVNYTAKLYLNIFGSSNSTVVVPDSFLVTRGSYLSGGVQELANSDNADLSIRRATADAQSRTEFEVIGASQTASPSTLEVTLEASVFARGPVIQTIELFDFDAATWEQIDARPASRLSDATITVAATGDLSRFIQPGTNRIEARIRYQSVNPRQRFSSNTDQLIWTIGQ